MKNASIPLVIACALLAVPLASAQAGSWHGQDNEFGSIRVPYALDMEGERIPVEAKVVLRKNYQEKDSRFFMFAFDVRGTNLNVEFTNLVRTDTGDEMPCYKREGDATSQMKCFVDIKHMPQPGVEIVMRGTVGASRAGNQQLGAIVLPFTYTWEKVQMSNGLPAELYGGSQIMVHTPTGGGGKTVLGGGGNNVPAPGALAAVGAIGVAVALATMRRR